MIRFFWQQSEEAINLLALSLTSRLLRWWSFCRCSVCAPTLFLLASSVATWQGGICDSVLRRGDLLISHRRPKLDALLGRHDMFICRVASRRRSGRQAASCSKERATSPGGNMPWSVAHMICERQSISHSQPQRADRLFQPGPSVSIPPSSLARALHVGRSLDCCRSIDRTCHAVIRSHGHTAGLHWATDRSDARRKRDSPPELERESISLTRRPASGVVDGSRRRGKGQRRPTESAARSLRHTRAACMCRAPNELLVDISFRSVRPVHAPPTRPSLGSWQLGWAQAAVGAKRAARPRGATLLSLHGFSAQIAAARLRFGPRLARLVELLRDNRFLNGLPGHSCARKGM